MRFLFFLLFPIFVLFVPHLAAAEVDFIIFSYNRPMQLYALLESSEKLLDGIGKTTVIVRAEDAEYKEAYNQVFQRFARVKVHFQGNAPAADFKPLLIQSLDASPSKYIMFAVDDIIVKDRVNLEKAVKMMLATHAWGFYLRMGKNITYSYCQNIPLQIPKGRDIQVDYFKWRFSEGKSYWCVFNTVDMTIYRKNEVEKFVREGEYINPNTFEDGWWRIGSPRKHGLCFQESKVLNIPLNLINNTPSRHMNAYSARDLLDKFRQGFKIDIQGYEKLKNDSAHFERLPDFIMRSQIKKCSEKMVSTQYKDSHKESP